LQLAGFSVVERQEIAAIDVGALRERLGLTQREFALRYGLNERTLQGWEQGRPMDDTAKAYLTVIAALPDVTSSALELAVHSTAQGGSSGTPVKR
jgi:DNA-binding transcriptional regulator YiaG